MGGEDGHVLLTSQFLPHSRPSFRYYVTVVSLLQTGVPGINIRKKKDIRTKSNLVSALIK